MSHASTSPQPDVVTDGRVAASPLLYRFRGRLQLAVIVKVAFSLERGEPLPPPEIVTTERTLGGNPTRSIEQASDLAPYKPRCDVTFVGHAHPPSDRVVARLSTRLGIARDDGRRLLDKVLVVEGRGRPLSKVPLVYERAVGGPGMANPYGIATPDVVDATDAARPGCYAPLSRYFPSRKQLVAGIDRAALDALTLPDAFAWEYYQVAPNDQQIGFPSGGEWLVLDGVHPAKARIEQRLPVARAVARVGPKSTFAANAIAVELVCDTLTIDGDRGTLAMVFRGTYPAQLTEDAVGALTIGAALQSPGALVDWSAIGASQPRAIPMPRASDHAAHDLRGTMAIDEAFAATSAARPALPFDVGAAQGAPSSALSASATPWGAPMPASPPAIGEEPRAAKPPPSKPGIGSETFALQASGHMLAAQRAVAPFAVASPGSEPRAGGTPRSGLPFGGAIAPPAPPASSALGRTLATDDRPDVEVPIAPPAPSGAPLLQPPIVAAPPLSAPSPRGPVMRPSAPFVPASAPFVPAPAPFVPAPAPFVPASAPFGAPTASVRGPVFSQPLPASVQSRAAAPTLADALRSAGASAADVSSLLGALAPPPPPPPEED